MCLNLCQLSQELWTLIAAMEDGQLVLWRLTLEGVVFIKRQSMFKEPSILFPPVITDSLLVMALTTSRSTTLRSTHGSSSSEDVDAIFCSSVENELKWIHQNRTFTLHIPTAGISDLCLLSTPREAYLALACWDGMYLPLAYVLIPLIYTRCRICRWNYKEEETMEPVLSLEYHRRGGIQTLLAPPQTELGLQHSEKVTRLLCGGKDGKISIWDITL